MEWILSAFGLHMVFRFTEDPISTVSQILTTLRRYGGTYEPTTAWTVDSDTRMRSILVDPGDARSIVRLGAREMDESQQKYRAVGVTLSNGTRSEVRVSLGTAREHLLDSLALDVHRERITSESDAQSLLSIAIDFESMTKPVFGSIKDVEVEVKDPVPFRHRRNRESLPERIYWANFWSEAMVNRLGGLADVLNAPAHEVQPRDDGSVLLLSTPTLLTYAAPEDVARRQAIWEWFDLEERHTQAGLALDEELRRRRKARGRER